MAAVEPVIQYDLNRDVQAAQAMASRLDPFVYENETYGSMPADLPKLSAEQKARLRAFTASGGVIISAGKPRSGIVARAEAVAEGPRLSLEPRGYVLGQLTRKPDGRTFILHLLNYDHQTPAENMKVRLELGGLVQDLSGWEVKVLSPDAAQPQFTNLSLHGNVCEFTLRRIDHYTVVTLSARPAR